MHDSLINEVMINKDNEQLVMYIDFAFWMQESYQPSTPETGILEVTFNNVVSYKIPDEIDWSEVSILSTFIENDTIKFMLLNDITDESLEISIESNAVTVSILD